MRIEEHTGTREVKVGAMSFPVSFSDISPASADRYQEDLCRQHVCIDHFRTLDEYEMPGTRPYVRTVQVILDDDADYQQICALRAQLKYR